MVKQLRIHVAQTGLSVMTARKTKEQLAEEKEAAAQVALKFVRSGMRLGLGSGSTADCFIRLLGDQVRHGALRVSAIATSKVSERRAVECGIPLIRPVRGLTLDLGIDGADEISPDLELIKGGGGALLREKVVERACRYFVVIADSSKLVERLGAFPLPVEVIPFSLPWVLDELEALGAKPMQRMIPGDLGQPYCTDQENYIVDCHFGVIEDARALERKLASMPGIAEHGIFIDYANAALVAHGREIIVLRPGHPASPLSAPEAACLEESIIPK